MPELPEVEVTRRSFADRITGATIQAVHMGKPLRWPLQCEPASLAGMRVRGVRRRGKYLLIDLSEGLLLVHLGMSGSVVFDRHLPPAGVHDHFDMVTDLGTLRLHDPRRFGAVVFAAGESDPVAQKLLGHLGVEPLGDGFEVAAFLAGLRQRKAPIKQVLLAGEVVVGVGNIYADESLFLSGIQPHNASGKLSLLQLEKLHSCLVEVLQASIGAGGTTFSDFRDLKGNNGNYGGVAWVYRRGGEPCRKCGSILRREKLGGRSSHWCPTCQC